MKIKFQIANEKTITNLTAKVTIAIQGTVQSKSRSECEQQALQAAKGLLPDSKWAFTNFQYNSDNLTFGVTATTRIDAQLNDRLADRAKQVSSDAVSVTVRGIDTTVPPFEIRQAESDLRVEMIKQATEEAAKLGGEVGRVEFAPDYSSVVSNSKAFASSTYSAGGGSEPAGALGHSEKITLNASVTVIL